MAKRERPDDLTVTSSGGSTPPPVRPRRVSRLGKLASFAQLRSRHLLEIERAMVERQFAAGAHLMRQGEEGDCLLVVQEGDVEVSVASGDERHVLKRAGEGEIFGEMALLTREPRTADVVALTPVRALVLPVAEFHRLLPRNPALAEVLSRLTAQRLGQETFDALSGKVFHGYTIRSRLGRGGMAVVYEAEEQASGRRVALKMMSHRLVFDARSRRLFQQEADLIASFEHENIVRMIGRFEAFRTFFIVMEYCDGAPLDAVLAAHERLDPGTVRRIVGQVAAALAYAHERRIVHRDIKPSNVMVNRDGVVKLMDFGVARTPQSVDEDADVGVIGTPLYMAPEQVSREAIGTATDLYALAGLAWEMLTGKTLFRAKTFGEVRRAQRAWKIPDPATVLPEIDDDLRGFLSACLVRDPLQRSADLQVLAGWADRVSYDELAVP